ncbi:MAG: type II toxin-antitoxin system HicB family antitoxin [Acidobacteriota bacterium]|nr:type II toxin-antitoxin system HicB family antitoxin [Acidobacteriota bacterium]
MLTYKAMYKFLDDGVHGEVLDFPGAITCGKDLIEARRLLASALVDMAETTLLAGESLPVPNPLITDKESDLEEPIHLILNASSQIKIVPEFSYEAA